MYSQFTCLTKNQKTILLSSKVLFSPLLSHTLPNIKSIVSFSIKKRIINSSSSNQLDPLWQNVNKIDALNTKSDRIRSNWIVQWWNFAYGDTWMHQSFNNRWTGLLVYFCIFHCYIHVLRMGYRLLIIATLKGIIAHFVSIGFWIHSNLNRFLSIVIISLSTDSKVVKILSSTMIARSVLTHRTGNLDK